MFRFQFLSSSFQVEVAGDWANAKPMLGLVAQQAYNKLTPGKVIELNLSKGLFVVSYSVCDIMYVYFITHCTPKWQTLHIYCMLLNLCKKY